MTGLLIKNVSKQFSDSKKIAVKHIELEVGEDEFLVLLGPSGCGKTTLLRMIAGLVTPTEGRIIIDGKDVTELEPQERGIGMVFQNYALYPHFNIRKNLTFGLEIAKVKRAERNVIVNEIGEILNIKKHFKQRPEMLSGGERQRVAMGRAMVTQNKVYLFDEPLSNLDEELRTKLRPEIVRMFREWKVPFVYVTHDQVDAMTMGTKVAVMKDGVIEQLATPQEIYDRPANLFVAEFVGSPKMNFLQMRVTEQEGSVYLEYGTFRIEMEMYREKLLPYMNQEIILGIRPEDLAIYEVGKELWPIICQMERYEYLGNKIQLYAKFGENPICITAPVMVRARIGEELKVYLDKKKVHLFDKENGQRI